MRVRGRLSTVTLALAALALAGTARAEEACRPLLDGPDGTVVTDLPATISAHRQLNEYDASLLNSDAVCGRTLPFRIEHDSPADFAWEPIHKRLPLGDEWAGGLRFVDVEVRVSGRMRCEPGETRCLLAVDKLATTAPPPLIAPIPIGPPPACAALTSRHQGAPVPEQPVTFSFDRADERRLWARCEGGSVSTSYEVAPGGEAEAAWRRIVARLPARSAERPYAEVAVVVSGQVRCDPKPWLCQPVFDHIVEATAAVK
ncbi:hypothetical protein [Caulobacter sp. 17J80-11]|uniref:hypothetical protein n=1 Tax=Caulobacter sp. 17J80-11 TaxID=2763502 RepID=UPI0016534485|nr:hypothetical protein [Caulobacter sp. 17J80-11]MBC6981371.1 hypothetical protein [Caulobacter sp. 17J80-11]